MAASASPTSSTLPFQRMARSPELFPLLFPDRPAAVLYDAHDCTGPTSVAGLNHQKRWILPGSSLLHPDTVNGGDHAPTKYLYDVNKDIHSLYICSSLLRSDRFYLSHRRQCLCVVDDVPHSFFVVFLQRSFKTGRQRGWKRCCPFLGGWPFFPEMEQVTPCHPSAVPLICCLRQLNFPFQRLNKRMMLP